MIDGRTQNEKDLTMLVKRLVEKIRKVNPDDEFCRQALIFLDRKNLTRVTDIFR